MSDYLLEPVDRLLFRSPGKARRYATERYRGAVGLNWYRCDPTLQFLMQRHLGAEGMAWGEPHLDRVGALIGGSVAERAEETDRTPPRLERYDRWGRETGRVVMPSSFEENRRDLVAHAFSTPAFRAEADRAGVDAAPLEVAWTYLLDQAEIGMHCALGTGAEMVASLAEKFAPEDVKERVRELLGAGELVGETAQMLTERTGGCDLGAIETTATREGDAWRLNGFKWFASNANGRAFMVLAKPEGAADSVRGVAPFLVLSERRDGRRNGVVIRRLKDKLGTKAVASAEVELRDAEAFLVAPAGEGLAQIMEMTNPARLAAAMMGLGCARRALVESLCYAAARDAFGAPLDEQPLMRRKLAEMIVDVEAAQALVFDGLLGSSLRLAAPLVKLRAARLGITAASDAIEVHGGNGYIEDWPVSRILRDAQVNTLWEGPDNILCLDVQRAIVKEQAHVPFLARVRQALAQAVEGDATVALVEQRLVQLEHALAHWQSLEPQTGELRLFSLAQFMVDVYAAALLLEQAEWETRTRGGDRKALVARLYARAHLADPGPLRGTDWPAEELERWKELRDGALIDERA